jgi:hypothetical protein
VYHDNVEIIIICVIYTVTVSIYFVSEDGTNQPPTVTVGQIVTEKKVSLLFSNEMDNDHCDALLPVKDKEKYVLLTKFVFKGNLC